MLRRHRVVWSLTAVAVVAIAGALIVAGVQAKRASSSTHRAADYGRAPSYTLTNQNGQLVSSGTFAGKVQVVSYLFPYCTSYCPLITRNLVLLERRLVADGLADKVQLVSFNVDPVGAGPGQLRAYLAQYGAHAADRHWQFLTGTPAAIRHVVTDGFHVDYKKVSLADENAEAARQKAEGTYVPQPEQPNAVADQAHVDYDVVHNDEIELVDRAGRIVYVFGSGSGATEGQLVSAVRDVLAERATAPRGGT
jgi:cytochrome oxidase Cu insertion factor (SCO1/SenC/PrrC family)